MIGLPSLSATDILALLRRMLLASLVLALPSLWLCPAAAAPVDGIAAAEPTQLLGLLGGHGAASKMFAEMAQSLVMMVMGAMAVLVMRSMGGSQLPMVAGA
mmetsp:Transcript_42399/g.76977  ORF Transcript_42399/g.76977 Transcript_42399/m.76977 type:complete len:101 (+) Transcript_42399:184-486(+)